MQWLFCDLHRDYLQSRAEKKMVNPLYERNPGVLLITVTALNVGLWRRLYLRTDAEEELELPGYEALRLLKEENKSRKERLAEVKRSACVHFMYDVYMYA